MLTAMNDYLESTKNRVGRRSRVPSRFQCSEALICFFDSESPT